MKFEVGDIVMKKLGTSKHGRVIEAVENDLMPYHVIFGSCKSWFLEEELELVSKKVTETAIFDFVPIACPWCASRIDLDDNKFLLGGEHECTCGMKFHYNPGASKLEKRIENARDLAASPEVISGNTFQDIIDILTGKGE